MSKLIECVPNFSEGRDMRIIKQITDIIELVDGVKIIDIDAGKATNRTVITMVGHPVNICEAAFLAIKKAAEVIDMSKHTGAHPRFGATDVCPLIPVSGITIDETVEYARQLAQRVGNELQIPVYCYEYAASRPERKNLASCRSGEYEGLAQKLTNPVWKPDFGPAFFDARVAKTGAIAIGARNFLIAYNVNLNTTSTRRANSVAFDIRERGRVKRVDGQITGAIVKDADGNVVYEPGLLKSVKAIGWYINEYNIAQISMNLTDLAVTPLHIAFDTACQQAAIRGLRVTGSELVGVVPLNAMLEAGKYFLNKQQRSAGVPDSELIRIAVKTMGLDELYPFEPNKKIIEYVLDADNNTQKLVNMSLINFANETASESPAPGGGSISAYMGALGAALGGMVANLSAHKRGWDSRWHEFSGWAEKAKELQSQLLKLVDDDTLAFNKLMEAFALPKKTDTEKDNRHKAIQAATENASQIPLKTMQLCLQSMQIALAMVQNGNPNSVTDAGVGAIAACAGVKGAFLNVKINAAGIDNKNFVNDIINQGNEILQQALMLETQITNIVDDKIS